MDIYCYLPYFHIPFSILNLGTHVHHLDCLNLILIEIMQK